MRTKKFRKRLTLNKQTVATLNSPQMNKLFGGRRFTAYTECEVTQCVETCPGCGSDSCPEPTDTCQNCGTLYETCQTCDSCYSPCISPFTG
jgi:hypothetical protein